MAASAPMSGNSSASYWPTKNRSPAILRASSPSMPPARPCASGTARRSSKCSPARARVITASVPLSRPSSKANFSKTNEPSGGTRNQELGTKNQEPRTRNEETNEPELLHLHPARVLAPPLSPPPRRRRPPPVSPFPHSPL